MLQAEQSVVHTVHLAYGEVHPGQRLVPVGLPQLLPVVGHLLAVAAPGGVELDEGVALPVQSR